MATPGWKLTRVMERVIAALLSESTHAQAAKAAGVSPATLHRYLHHPGFQAAYRAARRAILEGTINRLQRASNDAADTLERGMKCGTPATEVRAAQLVLEHSYKGQELLDLAERVAELERLLRGEGNGTVGADGEAGEPGQEEEADGAEDEQPGPGRSAG